MKKDIMKTLKLTSADRKNLTERLRKLVKSNADVPELAYAGNVNVVARCSCEKGCEGCTSW